MKVFGNLFQKFCWRLKRELKHNRKPILLFFGGGYDSQILLLALHKVRRKVTVIHLVHNEDKIPKKIKNVLKLFSKNTNIFMRSDQEEDGSKTWGSHQGIFFSEKNGIGFGKKEYLLITGHKMTEPLITRYFMNDKHNILYSPLLRYCDESIQELYQDMKDNERLGKTLFENLWSDSHHNIKIH